MSQFVRRSFLRIIRPEVLEVELGRGSMTDAVATKLADISYESVGLLQKLALRYLDDQLGISGARPMARRSW
jgi:hypothetical protein